MRMTDRERVGVAFSVLADGLAGPVDRVMCKAFDGRENWNELWAAAESQPGRRPLRYSKDDPQILLKAMTHAKYRNKFRSILKWHQQAWASELIEVRNRWAHNEPITRDDAVRTLDTIQRLLEAVGASPQAREVRQLRSAANRVLVGRPAQVGADYQPRGFDADLERLWADGGDRRVWLRGGPGLGKSYTARRLMHEAVADQTPDRELLLIWVDSADAASATNAFSEAVDQLGRHGLEVRIGSKVPADQKARALLEILLTSTWRWLIVLDDADAVSLFEAGMIPTGANPNGRVLITTKSRDHRITSNGRSVNATLFSSREVETYLRSEIHAGGSGRSSLATVDSHDGRCVCRGRRPPPAGIVDSSVDHRR